MIISMRTGSSRAELERVLSRAKELGCPARVLEDGALVALDPGMPLDPGLFEGLPGVREVLCPDDEHIPLARRNGPGDTGIELGGLRLGTIDFLVIAGPCAVESEAQLLAVARAVKAAGARALRAGAFKPRTSPYAFRGLGIDGLRLAYAAAQEVGLPLVTEAVDLESLEKVAEAADVVQIGARSMQNYPLLQEAGKLRKPVLLKRGPSASLDEWLLSAEYILKGGNPRVILCERGGRSASDPGRNGLDLGFVLAARERTHLPVIVDPSHGTARRAWVPAMAKASLAVGGHGVMVEVHDRPEAALSDSKQSLSLEEFRALMDGLRALAPVQGRTL